MNTIEIFQIFLIVVLLLVPFIIVRNKNYCRKDTEIKSIQVTIPTAIFVASILIMDEIKIIENPFIKIIIATSIYFAVILYNKNFYKKYIYKNINTDRK